MTVRLAVKKKYGRIRNGRQNVAPMFACLLVAALAVIMKMSLASSVHDIQCFTCDGARTYLVSAEQNYYRKYHRFVVGDEDVLQELVNVRMLRSVPQCRAGGRYTAVANADGSLTIRCSLPEHDKEQGITRFPYRHRH